MDITATVTLMIRVTGWGLCSPGFWVFHMGSNSLSIVPWDGGQSTLDMLESLGSQGWSRAEAQETGRVE